MSAHSRPSGNLPPSFSLLPHWGADIEMWVLRPPRGACTPGWPRATRKSQLTNMAQQFCGGRRAQCGFPVVCVWLGSCSKFRTNLMAIVQQARWACVRAWSLQSYHDVDGSRWAGSGVSLWYVTAQGTFLWIHYEWSHVGSVIGSLAHIQNRHLAMHRCTQMQHTAVDTAFDHWHECARPQHWLVFL